METKIVKEFTFSNTKDKKFFCSIIRRETPCTETGITWEVLKQVDTITPTVAEYDRYATAEMDFKNFVLEALNTDIFYTFSAEK